MSYNRKQFENLIRRILNWCDPDLCSDSAVNLLLGTAAQESRFGHFLRQTNGPALGAFQIEPKTFDWLKDKFKGKYLWLKDCKAEELEHDLLLSVIIARLRYKVDSQPLPDSDDIQGLAEYWKRVFNTSLGAGHVGDFVQNYETYVKGV